MACRLIIIIIYNNQTDWNLSAPKALEKSDATSIQKYYASKTLAEQAAWDFVKDKEFDLVTILPTVVMQLLTQSFFVF